ncbi:MAG: 3-phosphoshikimate 1-carboxyvinyltransferase [Bacteroidales bacterium]|nr:3-phosphoshikimate 1-carboxyvinyltransferase [Bacteroidales bacterium]
MKIEIIAPEKEIKNVVLLPASKSISNRMLTIQALCKERIEIQNLATSKDTLVLSAAYKNIDTTEIDIGATGTAMRFLTAFLSISPGERILTGDFRMKQRPIAVLVDILREFGAKIEYLEKEGFPPLKIEGTSLLAKRTQIKGNISSQYISALLMIAPYIDGDFELTIVDKILSKDYILMTTELMHKFGAEVEWIDNTIKVKRAEYKSGEITVESDWSSASYWFEIVSLIPNSEIELEGLHKNSLQGDSVLIDLFRTLGVESKFTNLGILIKNIATKCSFFEYDFSRCPDLVQTLVVTLVAKNIPFNLYGLDNLSIKETDRINALITEFNKLGIHLKSESNKELIWAGNETITIPENHIVETYDDHRMALAFAPISVVTKKISIKKPNVVIKSYPNYWDSLRKVGFKIQ